MTRPLSNDIRERLYRRLTAAYRGARRPSALALRRQRPSNGSIYGTERAMSGPGHAAGIGVRAGSRMPRRSWR